MLPENFRAMLADSHPSCQMTSDAGFLAQELRYQSDLLLNFCAGLVVSMGKVRPPCYGIPHHYIGSSAAVLKHVHIGHNSEFACLTRFWPADGVKAFIRVCSKIKSALPCRRAPCWQKKCRAVRLRPAPCPLPFRLRGDAHQRSGCSGAP
jgi:hypothetical protein